MRARGDARLEAALADIATGLRRAAEKVRGGRDPEEVFEELWDGDSDARVAAYDYLQAAYDEAGPVRPAGGKRRYPKPRTPRLGALVSDINKLTR